MARIPFNPLRQVIAGPTPLVQIPQGASGEVITRAAAGLADTVGQIGNTITNDRLQREDEARRSRATLATIEHETEIQTTAAKIADDLETGALKYDKAAETFAQARTTIDQKYLANVDDQYKPIAQQRFAGITGRAALAVDQASEKARRSELRGNYLTALDANGKAVGLPGADLTAINKQAEALAELGRQAGIPEADIAKITQDAKDRNTFADAQAKLIAAREDPVALKALEADLTAEGGRYTGLLDTERRNQLLGQVEGNQIRLQQKAELSAARALRLQEVRLNDAAHAVNALQQLADKGGVLAESEIERVTAATAGTPYAATAKAIFQQSRETGGFAAQPLAAQDATIRAIDQRIATEGRSTELDRRREQLAKVRDAARQDVQRDPLGAALERGVIDNVPPLDFSSPQALQASVTQRGVAVRQVAAWTGETVSPLLPQEAETLKRALTAATTDGKTTLFGTLASTLDQDTYFATLKQIAPDQPLVAAAGALQAVQARTTENRNVAALVLDGAALTKDKTFPLPKDKAGNDSLVLRFNEAIGGNGPGPFADSQTRNTAYEVTKAIYAKLSQEAGDTTGQINGSRFRQALDLATGGLYQHAGGVVAKPYGQPDDVFAERLGRDLQRQATAAGVPVSRLRGLPLVPSPTGEGIYYLSTGRDVLRGPDNAPIVVQTMVDPQPRAAGPDVIDSARATVRGTR